MRNPDDLLNENQALRERLSRLSEASLRITEDLDLATVLQGVVDGARSLTGARMGGITALDEQGQLQDFITSGLTPEEHQRFLELPGGPDFFAYLSMIPGPLRLADFSGHTTSAGLPEIGPPLGPVGSFLGAPIRHRGEHAGNLYLSDKEGGLEFTQEDEDTLLMFASQAAMAIANARRYREEQRARADLETLVNTSPVGVVVFDARTGAPVSLNREARRIVDGLRNPDQSGGGSAGDADRPAGRWAGDFPAGFPPGPGAQHRGNHSGRGDRASRSPTGAESPPSSTLRPFQRRTAASSP